MLSRSLATFCAVQLSLLLLLPKPCATAAPLPPQIVILHQTDSERSVAKGMNNIKSLWGPAGASQTVFVESQTPPVMLTPGTPLFGSQSGTSMIGTLKQKLKPLEGSSEILLTILLSGHGNSDRSGNSLIYSDANGGLVSLSKVEELILVCLRDFHTRSPKTNVTFNFIVNSCHSNYVIERSQTLMTRTGTKWVPLSNVIVSSHVDASSQGDALPAVFRVLSQVGHQLNHEISPVDLAFLDPIDLFSTSWSRGRPTRWSNYRNKPFLEPYVVAEIMNLPAISPEQEGDIRKTLALFGDLSVNLIDSRLEAFLAKPAEVPLTELETSQLTRFSEVVMAAPANTDILPKMLAAQSRFPSAFPKLHTPVQIIIKL